MGLKPAASASACPSRRGSLTNSTRVFFQSFAASLKFFSNSGDFRSREMTGNILANEWRIFLEWGLAVKGFVAYSHIESEAKHGVSWCTRCNDRRK